MASMASIPNCKICKITQPKNGSLWRDQHQMETLWHCNQLFKHAGKDESLDLHWLLDNKYNTNKICKTYFVELQWAIVKVLTHTNELLSTELLHTNQGQLAEAAGIPVQPTLPLNFHCYSINQRVLDWSTLQFPNKTEPEDQTCILKFHNQVLR